jgi:uridine kinase
MDLKIFIDTDNDIRLARTISQGIESGKSDLLSIITKFHKNIKPAYNTFISSTKGHANIILPNSTGHETAVKIITNYLKLLLDKVANNKMEVFFHF